MTPISRRNILELIGNHRGKYHSCILTCYNFDFSFFEEQVLPKLRTANIKNINVFADGHFLEQAQELTTGREFYFNKTYNFLPVYEKGVFHPKILFLTGVKHGLLIIGSGNITSSGLSTNDEIWGAFHLSTTENENAPLFKEVWDYLQNFTSINYGFLLHKIDWIKKYSPWLDNLPSVVSSTFLQTINQSISFVENTINSSIYQQLSEIVPKENLQSITVVSPYYDKNGQFIKQLFVDFQPIQMNCIVDTKSGLLPTELDSTHQQIISFYDWSDCVEKYNEIVNRLHAKMILFKYSDGSEYLLLGSANASMAAMGSLSSNSIARINYGNKILYAELKGLELTCYLKNPNTDDIWIVLIARNGEIQEKIVAQSFEDKITCRLSDSENVFKAYLEDAEGNRISNYIIIHRFEALLRCNPDPTQEKLDSLLENDFPDNEGFTSFFEYIDYDWADDESESNDILKPKSFRGSTKTTQNTPDKVYKRLESDEFNKISDEILAHQSGLLTRSNIKIADFLNIVVSGDVQQSSDFSESDEQKLLEDEEQKGEGEEIKRKGIRKINAQQEKRAIIRYFQKLEKIYSDKLTIFLETKALTETPNELITIKTLSKTLIALQILSIYHGKKYCITSNSDDSHLIEEYYVGVGKISDGVDTVKGFFMNVLGKFLILATGGFKIYDYEILNQKLRSYRIQAFEKSLFLCLNTNWNNDTEKKHLNLLLLNLHYFILPKDLVGNEYFTKLITNADKFRKKSKYISSSFADNLFEYEKNFLSKYIIWHNQFSSESERKQHLIKRTQDLIQNTIIFSSKIGFNCISKISEGSFPSLDLVREGYPNNGNEYILENVSYGQKCIIYNKL